MARGKWTITLFELYVGLFVQRPLGQVHVQSKQ